MKVESEHPLTRLASDSFPARWRTGVVTSRGTIGDFGWAGCDRQLT
jgi:hypothetical protein